MSATPKIAVTTVVTHGDEQVAAEIDGEVVMMSLEQGNYYGLDSVGSRIWTLLQQPQVVSAVCDILQQEFVVDRATCECDVLEFLNRLAAEKLIRVVNETPG